jgi:hypothetical protein
MAAVVAACGGCSSLETATPTPETPKEMRWLVRERGSLVEISYGRDRQFVQYAALHTESSYFRLVFGPDSGWGTSVVLLPSFWSGGQYYQGAPITADWKIVGDDLVVSFDGDLSTLHVDGWKRSAPTMTIRMDAARPVTGWVTESQDPNDDNVGWWQASDQILSSWSYSITATRP